MYRITCDGKDYAWEVDGVTRYVDKETIAEAHDAIEYFTRQVGRNHIWFLRRVDGLKVEYRIQEWNHGWTTQKYSFKTEREAIDFLSRLSLSDGWDKKMRVVQVWSDGVVYDCYGKRVDGGRQGVIPDSAYEEA